MSIVNLVVDGRYMLGSFAKNHDVQKIVNTWASICGKKQAEITASELDYVISKQSVSASRGRYGSYPNLDVSNCDLNDLKVICLIEALAMRPAVAKLDITGNAIGEKSVETLLRLLRGQAKLARSIPQGDRLQLTLLGEVELDYFEGLDHDILQEVSLLASALNLVNAQAYIRSAYKQSGLREPVDEADVRTLWTAVFGDPPANELEGAYLAAGQQDRAQQSALSYAEAEAVLLAGFIDQGLVSVPNEWQMEAIGYAPEWLITYHDRAVQHALSGASPATPRSPYTPRSPRSPATSPQARHQARQPRRMWQDDAPEPSNDSAPEPAEVSLPAPVPESELVPVSVPVPLPVVALKIPDDELADSGSDDGGSAEEEARPYDESLDAGEGEDPTLAFTGPAAAASAGYPAPRPSLVTASLFTAKYMNRAAAPSAAAGTPSPAPRRPSHRESALQSPTSSSKPGVARPAYQHRQEDLHLHHAPAPKPSVTKAQPPSPMGREGGLEIRYDAISALQNMGMETSLLSTLPKQTPGHTAQRAATSSAYFADTPTLLHGDKQSHGDGRERDGNRDDHHTGGRGTVEEKMTSLDEEIEALESEYYGVSNQLRKHRESRSEQGWPGSNAGVANRPPSPPPLSSFVVDLALSPTSPRKLNVLTLCNSARNDYELGDQLGWPRDRPQPISVLTLRENGITHPERLSLSLRFECLTDLDLCYNNISGAVKGLPATLLRLNLSHNRITNVSNLLQCANLVDLNLSHNDIKSFHELPAKLEKLDLSHNVIASMITLRTLALSPLIRSLNLLGNPVLLEVKDWKITVTSLLRHLDELNWKPLFTVKKADALMRQIEKKYRNAQPAPAPVPQSVQEEFTHSGSPRRSAAPPVSAQEQRVNDVLRMRHDNAKFAALEQARREYEDRFRKRSTILRPQEADRLTHRLTLPNKIATIRAATLASPPPLFSQLDLLHRKYPHGPPSGGATAARRSRGGRNPAAGGYGSPSRPFYPYTSQGDDEAEDYAHYEPEQDSRPIDRHDYAFTTELAENGWAVNYSAVTEAAVGQSSPLSDGALQSRSFHTDRSAEKQDAPEPALWGTPTTGRSDLTMEASDSPRGGEVRTVLSTEVREGTAMDTARASVASGSTTATGVGSGTSRSAFLDGGFLSSDTQDVAEGLGEGGGEGVDREPEQDQERARFDSLAYSVLSEDSGRARHTPLSLATHSQPSSLVPAIGTSAAAAGGVIGAGSTSLPQDGDEFSVNSLSTATDIPPARHGGGGGSFYAPTQSPPSAVPAAAVALSGTVSPAPSHATSLSEDADTQGSSKLSAKERLLARMAKLKK